MTALVVGVIGVVAGLLALTHGGDGPNPADRRWAAMMVPHHLAGTALDDLALRRTGDVRIRRLAFEMNGYQGAELDALRRLAGDAPADDATGTNGIPTPADLAALAALQDRAFDRRFLELMIVHHRAAIAMSTAEAADGTDGTGRALARGILEVQTRQLSTMEALLAALG